MEQVILSREEYDGGQRVIRRFMESGFDVLAAFWAKHPDDRSWTLWTVSPRVDETDRFAVFNQVRIVLDSLQADWAHPFERIDSSRVWLTDPSNALAERVVDCLTKHALALPRWHHVCLPWPNQYDDVLICPLPGG